MDRFRGYVGQSFLSTCSSYDYEMHLPLFFPRPRVCHDGGFIHNKVFRAMLRYLLKDHELIFSDLPLGSAYGAASVLKHAISYKRLVKG